MTKQEKKRKKYLEQKCKQEGSLSMAELFELKRLYEKESERLSKISIVLPRISLIFMVVALICQIALVLMRL